MNNNTNFWLFGILGIVIFCVGIFSLFVGNGAWAIVCMMSGIWSTTMALVIRKTINGIDERFERLTRLLAIHFKEDREKVDWTKEGF